MLIRVTLIVLSLLTLNTTATATPAWEFHRGERSLNKNYPFSEAVRVGDLLFLAGKLGTLPDNKGLTPGGIGPETRQAMENIKTVVERYGSDMNRVAKCTVFLADMNEWSQMNDVYRTFFKDNFPARSAVEVSGLAINARVEIECIAVL